jgi:large subunit ribosomal protein L35
LFALKATNSKLTRSFSSITQFQLQFQFCTYYFNFHFPQASAKRFRVTGAGKIVRRRAGKQHLLYKKNKKRKLRLSKLVTSFFNFILHISLLSTLSSLVS